MKKIVKCKWLNNKNFCIFASEIAVIAQLAERWLPKPKVAGSSPVYRSNL